MEAHGETVNEAPFILNVCWKTRQESYCKVRLEVHYDLMVNEFRRSNRVDEVMEECIKQSALVCLAVDKMLFFQKGLL